MWTLELTPAGLDNQSGIRRSSRIEVPTAGWKIQLFAQYGCTKYGKIYSSKIEGLTASRLIADIKRNASFAIFCVFYIFIHQTKNIFTLNALEFYPIIQLWRMVACNELWTLVEKFTCHL